MQVIAKEPEDKYWTNPKNSLEKTSKNKIRPIAFSCDIYGVFEGQKSVK